MAIRIKLPNGQYGNFPDDMPHDQIEAVLQKQFPRQPEEQGFWDKSWRNVGAGVERGVKGLANIPHDIATIAGGSQRNDPYEQRLMQTIGEQQQQPNAERIPHFAEQDYSKKWGITGEPTLSDKAIQMASEFALPVGGTLKAGSKGIKAAARVLSDLPLTQKMASRSLNEARALSEARNAHPGVIPEEIMQDIPQFLPNTTPYRKLIEQARTGEYNPLFDLQSDLGHQSRDYMKSLFSAAERRHGREAHGTRERLLDAMRGQLSEQGHHDIAELMKHGQNRYRQYKKLMSVRNKFIGIGLGGTGIKKLYNIMSSD